MAVTLNPMKCACTEMIGCAGVGSSDMSTLNWRCLPDFWFDNRSIILYVETTLFCMHRSMLYMHSEVFADMFHIPQPPNQCAIEGCSVIQLPDSADDFAYLLKVLYDPMYTNILCCHSLDLMNQIFKLFCRFQPKLTGPIQCCCRHPWPEQQIQHSIIPPKVHP